MMLGPSIVHIFSGNEIGGCSAVAFSLIKKLETSGLRVFVLLLRESSLHESAKRCGLKVTIIPRQSKLDWSLIKKIRTFMKEIGCGLIHTHSIGSTFYGRAAKLLLPGTHLVTTVHADTLNQLCEALGSPLMAYGFYKLDSAMAIMSDRLLPVSNALADLLVARGMPRSKVTVIRNGIDLPALLPGDDVASVRAEFGLSHDVRVVAAVGRLVPLKNLGLFLDMAKVLLDRRDAVRFIIIGDGPLRAMLERMACDLGVREKVIFTGWRSDMARLYRLMDVFVLTSTMEALPVSVLEAMAFGKPVVATDVGGVPEIVRDGETGLLVRARDGSALCEAVTALLDDASRRRLIGQAGRKRVEQEFSMEVMAEKVCRVYAELQPALECVWR